jgi:hypothetical protein
LPSAQSAAAPGTERPTANVAEPEVSPLRHAGRWTVAPGDQDDELLHRHRHQLARTDGFTTLKRPAVQEVPHDTTSVYSPVHRGAATEYGCEREADHVADQALRARPPTGPAGEQGPAGKQDRGAAPGPGPAGLGSPQVPAAAQEILRSPGQPLDQATRALMESSLGHDFSRVRIHTDEAGARSARRLGARAYTVGPHVVLGADRYRPDPVGRRLLAHELVHVVQQGNALPLGRGADAMVPPILLRSMPRVAKQEDVIQVGLITSRDEYQPPGTRLVYRVGDAAASRLLMDIQDRGTEVVFLVFNFETGSADELTPDQWDFFRGAAIIGGNSAAISRLGRQLPPARWRQLWPNPMPELLRMFEAGQLSLEDEALLTGYRGMIRGEARRSLDENERTIDEFLGAPDRMAKIQDYATGLREASLVRDALVQRRDELSRQLVAQHSFTFGLPKAGTGPDTFQRLRITAARDEVADTLAFWLQSFPLLTRLSAGDINAGSVEVTLREIKANISSARQELNTGRLDPMTLDNVRARLTGQLGPRATAVVEAEDRSRRRWAIAGTVALTIGSIAIAFLPGGIFIDAAIGVALAGHAIANAIEVGRLANTGLHVDDGLVSQAEAQGARFAAVLAVVFAVVGAVAAGFRVLRTALVMQKLSRSMPELAFAQRTAVARAIAGDAALVTSFSQVAPGDTMIAARVTAALREAASDPRALREALRDVARIAAIPRRVAAGPDLYEPLRAITDGSDIAQIAKQTGFSRAEVEAVKRHLMLDEHIMVDGTGALYRGRFDPWKEFADVWAKAARGEQLAQADRKLLTALVHHEFTEGTLMSGASGRSLEQAFLRGELDGMLKKFLRSTGKTEAIINNILANPPGPVTPYFYAHVVAVLSGAPNP